MTSYKKLVFALALLLTFSSFASNNLTLELKIVGKDFYSILDNHLFGSYSKISGHFNVSGTIDGQRLNLGQAIPSSEVENKTYINILDKNAVKIVEEKSGISGVAKAKVKKSFGGKIKSLTISKEEYLSVMGPILEQSGLDLLTQMQIEADDAKLSTSMDLSDIECVRLGELLRCDSELTLIINVSDR